MKPRIGIDIDDVLSETTRYAISELKKRYNHNMSFEEVLYFEWPKITHFPLDLPTTIEFFREILRDTSAIDAIQPIPDSIASIQSLSHDFELHAITARHISTSEATHLWTAKYFGDAFSDRVEFLGLMQSGTKTTKGDACIQYELEVFVEDNIDYALSITEKGIPCFLMERPWNKQRTEEHELLVRVKNWKEAHDGIKKLYLL